MTMSAGSQAKNLNQAAIKSLTKVLQILECFSRRDANLTPADIAARTGLPRATTHRLVSSLRDIGLLEQNGKRETYKLGMKLFQLGNLVIQNLDLDSHARPYAAQLQLITGESTHLCIFDGAQMAFVERQEMNSTGNTMVTRIEAAPVHCTSVGKAFLAWQPPGLIRKIIDDSLPQRTPFTLAEGPALEADLQRIRERGYSLDLQENELGVHCIGAPVRAANGQVFAAISVSGPAERLPLARLEGLASLVIDMANKISLELGWTPPRPGLHASSVARRSDLPALPD
ncbi:MAG: IclR family transcriptional regulator [Enterobacterales bacterium endosymbiont of Blomia tropicalis]|uniref:IclR family transcriptional regulator n=1 Tax=Mixta mediterraneensis TaxID=2758443 RepID=UPI001875387D|nr:IclR family transcriptional regulator [Mixta mediterraneensis]MBE5252471.1 IclR family transcriptional regulator [Mixta mediterraneensis]MDL4915175.1 IclR family transcriptional regulator [Mixta mediterraneensis]